ncbi:btb poz domain-containing protein [Colletotrichum incanum]|uniref:Btb poz domain-containing protein n=1 Tax=Colletotrichum incanum TaxID=1573173 RepID=A0A166NE16_COLIC|nr:btb poz domain-containing protein [Colletotrichum incanum]
MEAKSKASIEEKMPGSSSRSNSSSTKSLSSLYIVALTEQAAKDKDPDTPPEEPRRPVAPQGELVLVVGPSKVEIRVYALILSNASPVFASMLGKARFGEGVALQDATPSNPVRISLPDDDPAAMETICRVIHGKTLDAGSPSVLDASPSEVLAVAMLADKYDCSPAMALAAEHWLKPETMEDMARWGHICPKRRDLLIAAYWFKHEKGFEAGSRRLLAEISGSFRPLAEGRESLDENIALRVALALEEKRNELRLSLYTSLMQPIINPPVCKCSRTKRRWWRTRSPRPAEVVNSVIRCIDRDVMSRGMPYMSINEAIRRAEEIPKNVVKNRTGRSAVDWKYPDGEKVNSVWRPWHKGLMWHRAEEFREKELKEGVCLRCIHPQMRCEEPRHNERRLQEIWEWLTPGAKSHLQHIDGVDRMPEW